MGLDFGVVWCDVLVVVMAIFCDDSGGRDGFGKIAKGFPDGIGKNLPT